MKTIKIEIPNSLSRRIENTWGKRALSNYHGSINMWLQRVVEREFPPPRTWLVGKLDASYPDRREAHQLRLKDLESIVGYQSNTNGSTYIISIKRYGYWGNSLTHKTMYKHLVFDLNEAYLDVAGP